MIKVFKDECQCCGQYKANVHSYFDTENNIYILCPDCLKKNKSVVRNWRNEPIKKERKKNDKNKNIEETRVAQPESADNNAKSNRKDGSKDKRQLLHTRTDRRKKHSEQPEHRPGRRKVTLI